MVKTKKDLEREIRGALDGGEEARSREHGITPGLVLAVAASVPDTTGRSGRKNARFGHKVFVSAIWRGLPPGSRAGSSLEDFKGRLLDWHREGEIELARCDMPGEVERSTMDASEISVGDRATFHAVALPIQRSS